VHCHGCGVRLMADVLQGMNFVAGCLLLFMDEEDAFWSLACVIEDLLPGYFSTAMVEPQVGGCLCPIYTYEIRNN
jgi:hypothetical protein